MFRNIISGCRYNMPVSTQRRHAQNPRHACMFLLVCLLLELFLLPVPYSDAHPHVFVANRFQVVFDDSGLAGIRVKWVFDRYFSQMIADEFDLDKDGALDAGEIASIEEHAFSNLESSAYFTFIQIDAKPFVIQWVRDFKASLNKGVLNYEFLIPCHVKATEAFKEIRVSPYDPSYYTLVLFAQTDAVTLIQSDGFETDFRVAKNMQESYYDGQVNPYEMALRFRLAP